MPRSQPAGDAAPEAGHPRPAATVLVVRDGSGPQEPGGLEVLMVRRNVRSEFVGGAYVFPGGAVDAGDGGSDVAARCAGLDDRRASGLLGVASGGLAYWVAGVRECFEEAGVLLAYRAGSCDSMLSLAAADDERRFAAHRRTVNEGRRRFLDVCAGEDLVLATDRIFYFSHWITPAGAPRRYDTRFFVAAAPPDQYPAHDEGETVACEWLAPADALLRHRQGRIELIFPTIKTLQAIERFDTASALVAAAAEASSVAATEPRVVADGTGVRILLAGDPGYEAGTGVPLTSEADFDAAVRAASRAANPPDGVTGS